MPGLFARDGEEFVANGTTFNDQRRPAVARLASGNFIVVWDDLSRTGGDTDLWAVRARLFDQDGNPLGGEWLVNSSTAGGQQDARVTALEAGFVVTWTDYSSQADGDGSSVKAQLYDAASAPIGGELLVNMTTAGHQQMPSVSGLPGGGFVAVWTDIPGLLSLQGNIKGQIFSASGAKVGEEFTVNSIADIGQHSAFVTTLADGRFLVTWTDATTEALGDGSGRSVRGQLFASDGTPIGTEFTVNTIAQGHQDSPAVAPLASGGFVAVWTDATGDDSGAAIEGQLFDAAGNRIGGEFQVNSVTQSGQVDATVTAMPSGGYVVSWVDHSVPGQLQAWSEIKAQAFDAAGNPLGGEFELSSFSSQHNEPAIAALDGDRFVAVWHGGTGGGSGQYFPGDIRTRIFKPVDGLTQIYLSEHALIETHPNEVAVGELIAPTFALNAEVSYAIVADSTGGAFSLDGNRLVVADNARLDFETAPAVTVTIRAFDGAGGQHDQVMELTVTDAAIEQRWQAADEVQVNVQNRGHQLDSVVSALTGGSHVVVWSDYGPYFDPVVKGKIYGSDGTESAELLLGSYQATEPAVARLASGGFVVTWSEGDTWTSMGWPKVKGRIFDAAGNAVSDVFALQADAEAPGAQRWSDVAGLPAGGFVAAWHDGTADGSGSVRARMFDGAGQPAGPDIVVSAGPVGAWSGPAIAAFASGGFIVAWSEDNGTADGDGAGIKAQRFDAAGDPDGSAWVVNTITEGDQYGPAVTELDGGNFLISWHVQTSMGDSVRAQLFGADGARIGAEFLVESSGRDAAVTPLDGGGFFIAVSTPEGIVAHLFDGEGNRVGSEWLVNDDRGAWRGPDVATLASGEVAFTWTHSTHSSDGSDISVHARNFFPLPTTVAADDGFATGEHAVMAGNLFADNGSGRDRGELSVTAVNGEAAAVGQPITLPSGALLTLNQDGTFTYADNGAFGILVDPASGASNGAASDSFTYTLGGESDATVTIDVAGVTEPGEPFIGSVAADVVTGTPGDDVFRLEHGANDYAAGGDGDDVFYFGWAMDWLDQTSGGAGDDRVLIQGLYNMHFGVGNFFEVETLVLMSSRDDGFGGASGEASSLYDYSLSLLDGAIPSGHALTIDAEGLLAGESLVLDASQESASTLIVRSGAGDDRISAGAGDDILSGAAADDELHGGGGGDLLNGGSGADTMHGGLGDDRYLVDVRADRIVEHEGGGTDMVQARVDYSLPASVENLTLTGGAMIGGTGNALANNLVGNNAINRLDGGAGADVMAGGLGHDTYVVDHVGDRVIENGSSGNDTVESSVDFNLPTHVEKLILTGAAGRTGRGNSGDNRITGNGGGNFLNGGGGDDVIDGGAGNDRLIGHNGKDTLSGGAGADRFEFITTLGSANVDRIMDFSVTDDTIQLARSIFTRAGANGTLAPAAFHQGNAAADAGDRILYDQATGALFYDSDGSGAAAAVLFATVTPGTALTHADFVIFG